MPTRLLSSESAKVLSAKSWVASSGRTLSAASQSVSEGPGTPKNSLQDGALHFEPGGVTWHGTQAAPLQARSWTV